MAKRTDAEIKALVDEFINNKTTEFSKPICKTLREILLKCGLKENYKWQMPSYDHHGIVCSLGSFKKHVGLWFMQGAMLSDPNKILIKGQATTKALRSMRFNSMEDLDEKMVGAYVKEAMLLNEKGIKFDHKKTKKELIVPDEFEKRLKLNKKAWEHFQNFSYTKKKDYVEWISTAKREETKEKRTVQAIEMLAQGIGKNDKYIKR